MGQGRSAQGGQRHQRRAPEESSVPVYPAVGHAVLAAAQRAGRHRQRPPATQGEPVQRRPHGQPERAREEQAQDSCGRRGAGLQERRRPLLVPGEIQVNEFSFILVWTVSYFAGL